MRRRAVLALALVAVLGVVLIPVAVQFLFAPGSFRVAYQAPAAASTASACAARAGVRQERSRVQTVRRAVAKKLSTYTPSVLKRAGRRIADLVLGKRAESTLASAPSFIDRGLAVSVLTSGLVAPTAMATLGPGEFLVVEKISGKVQHVRDGRIVGPAIDLAVNSLNERGGLGITLHPDFVRTRYVYVYWTWRGDGRGQERLEGDDTHDVGAVARLGNRVDRFRWDGRRLRFDRNIIRLPAYEPAGAHNGGVLRFGPDGKLYILVGDQYRKGRLQNFQDGPWPTDENFAGVIIRLNDDGTTPRDNPFFAFGSTLRDAEAGRNLQRTFAYGIRNGFGMDFDPEGRALWLAENGATGFDEINRVTPGFNSGWIQVMGPLACMQEYRTVEMAMAGKAFRHHAPASLATSAEEARSLLVRLPGSHFADPKFSWRFAVAPVALTFLTTDALGPGSRGTMIVSDFHGRLYRFGLSADRRELLFRDQRLADAVADNRGRADTTETESLVFARGFGIVSDLKEDADGTLLALSLTHGQIYRITAGRR